LEPGRRRSSIGVGFSLGVVLEQRHIELAIIAKHFLAAGRDGGLITATLLAEEARAPERVQTILKAAVAAGTTTDANWASALTPYRSVIAAFVESLRSSSVFYRILRARQEINAQFGG
jgi:hypothetical protein